MLVATVTSHAGDDSSGPIKYSVDLGARFTTYELTKADREWAQRLAIKFKYNGKIAFFVRTSLPIEADGKTIEGSVYNAWTIGRASML